MQSSNPYDRQPTEAYPRIDNPFNLQLQLTNNVVGLLNELSTEYAPLRSEVTYDFPLTLLPSDFSWPWSIAKYVPPSEGISTSLSYVSEESDHATISLSVVGERYSIFTSYHADEPFRDIQAVVTEANNKEKEFESILKGYDLDQWQNSITSYFNGEIIGRDATTYFNHTNAIRTTHQEFQLESGRTVNYHEENIMGSKSSESFSIIYETGDPNRKIRFSIEDSAQKFEVLDTNHNSIVTLSADEGDMIRLNEILEEETHRLRARKAAETLVRDMTIVDSAAPKASAEDSIIYDEDNF